MLFTLKSPQLTVIIEDSGAQLASIQDQNGIEYLWQGNPDIWPRRAPLLFPIIARLKNSEYTLHGQTRTIPTHGFCRTAPFAGEQQGENQVSFRFADTPETRKVYPFAFRLTVTYRLEENCLSKTHVVENLSDEPMYYELGGHDGFNIPLRSGETMGDYAVRVPGIENTVQPYCMDEQQMVIPKDKVFSLQNGRIPPKPAAFGQDTIILGELPEKKAVLVDAQDRPIITMEFEDFTYLGIWTAAKDFDTNYVCIEPWTTLPDATFAGRGLHEKIGIRTLAPGASERLRYTTIIHGV